MKRKYLIISTVCLLLSSSINAQVTIGSAQKPATGALLDLKQETDGTSKKGLGMPRVQLQDVDKLKMSATGTEYTDKIAHTGLAVYHVSGEAIPKCAPIPDGLYVWDGSKWNGIGVTRFAPASLDISPKLSFDLPSGTDARPLTAQSFTATWQSSDGTVTYTNAASAGMTAVPFSGANALPAGGSLTPSPRDFPLLPDAMTIVPATPWQSKETTLTFDVAGNECYPAQSKTITLNQTNYALKVNNQFTNSQIFYTTPATASFAVQGNATWTTSKIDPNNILSTTTPAIGTTAGENKKDGTTGTPIPNFSYTTAASTRYQTADITFKDTESTKRFADITVSIINCNTAGNDPSMNAWALRAGFTQTEINSVTAGGTHATTQPNGIQLHRDQSGNIFLSGLFGTQRWMLNNLSATIYAKAHVAGRGLSMSYNATDAYDAAYYAYPNVSGTAATLYNDNPRLGLLYTWDAATGGKGGVDGKANITDSENASTPNTDPQTTPIQGICPNGWHLPSDWEWTQLEKEINTNTSHYSGIADANGTITVGEAGWRGNMHGKGMNDACPTPGQTTSSSNGASNVISATIHPGFSALFAGYAYSGSVYNNYGAYGILWSASGNGTDFARNRYVRSNYSQVTRGNTNRNALLSVRCKK